LSGNKEYLQEAVITANIYMLNPLVSTHPGYWDLPLLAHPDLVI